MEIFLGISIVVLIIVIYFAFLKNKKISTSGGVTKYDIQMVGMVILTNTITVWFVLKNLINWEVYKSNTFIFYFSILLLIITSWYWFVLKKEFAGILYLIIFLVIIWIVQGDNIISSLKNLWKTNHTEKEVKFEIHNTETGEIAYCQTPFKERIPYPNQIRLYECGKTIKVFMSNPFNETTLTGCTSGDVKSPPQEEGNIFTIVAVK